MTSPTSPSASPSPQPPATRDLTTALSAVSATALLTLWARATESRSADPLLDDPVAEAMVDQLRPLLATTDLPMHRRLVEDRLPPQLIPFLALRARYYDQMARDFCPRFPRAAIVNLGCGLDTRFERLDDGEIHVLDLDLPPMIALKQQLVAPHPRHPLLAASVTDLAWMEQLDRYDDGRFLFLAEGLLMYLPQDQVHRLVLALAERFPGSELVAEVFNVVWLRPPWRGWIETKMRRRLDFGQGAMFQSGLRSPRVGSVESCPAPARRVVLSGYGGSQVGPNPPAAPCTALAADPVQRTLSIRLRWQLG